MNAHSEQEADRDDVELADRYREKRTRRIWQLSRLATREVRPS